MLKLITYPNLKSAEQLLKRPSVNAVKLEKQVTSILRSVRKDGDAALKRFAFDYDRVRLKGLQVSKSEIARAEKQISSELRAAMRKAASNISKFHKNQIASERAISTMKGIKCWRRSVAIERVGLYIPGGSAPLLSTVLMLGIPARIAGCKEIIICSPSNRTGRIAPEILYAAKVAGITRIFKVGGAQAIAAMAFGTRTIPQVDKIFGPGNQYVTCAKQLIQKEGVAIDMPAGPSEVLVIADDTCQPAFVASDLLSQAEHGVDSQAILICTSRRVINAVNAEIKKQLSVLSRNKIAARSIRNSRAVLVKNLNDAISISNAYAPEHLILSCKNCDALARRVINAGSVFIGNYSPESAGDYASGTNHTLPTNGFAKAYSGVSVDSFIKKISYQKINKKGLKNIAGAVTAMASAEGLDAHKNAITVRLK